MMTEEQLKTQIMARAIVWADALDNTYASHVAGQIRGLISALTGKAPPQIMGLGDVFTAAGIPFTKRGTKYDLDDAWLISHGFKIGDTIYHPDLERW